MSDTSRFFQKRCSMIRGVLCEGPPTNGQMLMALINQAFDSRCDGLESSSGSNPLVENVGCDRKDLKIDRNRLPETIAWTKREVEPRKRDKGRFIGPRSTDALQSASNEFR